MTLPSLRLTRLLLSCITLLFWGTTAVQAQVKEQLLYLDSDMTGIRERLTGTAFAEDFWTLDNKLVVLKYNSTKATYSFNNDLLYQVDLMDEFDRKTEAEKTYTMYIDYVRQIGGIPIEFKNEGDRKSMAAEKDDKIFVVSQEPKETGSITVTLSMQYTERSPSHKTEMVLGEGQ